MNPAPDQERAPEVTAPPSPPGQGQGRFVWRYLLSYGWPQAPPTQQDLQDFVHTYRRAGRAVVVFYFVLVAAVLALPDPRGLAWIVVACAVVSLVSVPAAIWIGRRQWRRRQL